MNQPRSFGPYSLIRRLAVGGMAEIYVASTRGLGGFEKLAALKLVHPHLAADPQFVRMLVEEAKILVLLTHANIAQVFDLGCIEGTYYIAMEFVDGLDTHGLQTAAQREGKPLPIAVCAYMLAEMLNGLDYAHRKRDASGRPLNIVHRDISPQNVVVSQAGEVKLVDFGIAKSSRQSEGTEAGIIKGKYFYMSPEQAWGDPTDRRSDVFASGILLFEMLTGHMLYNGKSVPELIGKVRRAEVPQPESLRGDIPSGLSEIVMRALQREPGARYQSAIDMGEALRDFLYGAYPAFNAGKLGEFVTEMVERTRAREALAPGVDDTRKMRALTRDEFVSNEDSVLFNLRDAGVLVTRQNAQGKPRRPATPPRPAPSIRPSVPARAAAEHLAPLPPDAREMIPTLPPRPGVHRLPMQRASERPRARISTWPLEETTEDPTELWSQARFPRPAAAPNVTDTEATRRYSPSSAPPPGGTPAARAREPSIIPSLEPPPPLRDRPNPFGEAPLTGTGKVALVPPRGEERALDPIPPSPLVPDFRASSSAIPWLPVIIGLLCAVLGIFGYQLLPQPEPAVHLEIVSAPNGAQVRLDGRLQNGHTPLRLSGLRAGKRYALSVELAGYQAWQSSYVAGQVSVQQIAVLRPITRTLAIGSLPDGAEVYLGDTLVGRTPLALPSVQVETKLVLRLEKAGYQSALRELTIKRDELAPHVSVTLHEQP
jgi:eukaryotic-like serine/threonine-protein kinase